MRIIKKYKLLPLVAILSTVAALQADEIKVASDQLGHLDLIDANGVQTYALKFPTSIQRHYIDLTNTQMNWSDKKALTMRLFRPSAEPGKMIIMLRSKTDTKSPDEFPLNYWWKIINGDWAGWKDISIPLSDFTVGRVPGAPTDITQIIFQNQFGPANETWGIPQPLEGVWGIGQIVVE